MSAKPILTATILLAAYTLGHAQPQGPIPTSGSMEAIRYQVVPQMALGMFPVTWVYAHPANPNTIAIRFTFNNSAKESTTMIVPVAPVPTWVSAEIRAWGTAAAGGLWLTRWSEVVSFQMEELQVTALHKVDIAHEQ